MPTSALVLPLVEGAAALDSGGDGTPEDGFVAGPENRLLARAVEAFCTEPECPYNPLVLYGRSGVGKSHVALAIAKSFTARRADRLAVSVTGREFASEYAAAVAARSVPDWRERLRSASLLVLDGIEALGEKLQAQVEFLHTVDAVIGDCGRVVVTARTAPADMSRLLPQLAGRLCGGIAIGVAAPGPAARLVLLRRFAKRRDVRIVDAAARLLAEELAVTAPELSGALHEVAGSLGGAGTIDLAGVRSYLRGRPAGSRTTLQDIAVETARHYSLSVALLRSASRRQSIALARGVAMYLARQLTGKSLASIGRYFGGRDHTTVLHACRKTEELMARDATLRHSVLRLREAQRDGGTSIGAVELLSKRC